MKIQKFKMLLFIGNLSAQIIPNFKAVKVQYPPPNVI
jgi:hypothetical protein